MIKIHSVRRISAENLRMKSIIFTREEKFLIKFCFIFGFFFSVICVFIRIAV